MTRRELLPGATGTAERVVGTSDLASALSPDHTDHFPDVFATAQMVALVEMAAARVARGFETDGRGVDQRDTFGRDPWTQRARARFGMEGVLSLEVFAKTTPERSAGTPRLRHRGTRRSWRTEARPKT
jgi:hypothetical protein